MAEAGSTPVSAKTRPTVAWEEMEKEDLIKLMNKQLMLLKKTKQRCDEFGSKNVSLTAKLAEKDQECASLQDKLKTVEEEQAEDCRKISSLVSEKRKLDKQIKDLEEQLGCMQMKQETVMTTFQCLQTEVNQLQNDNKNLKSELSVLEEARDAALGSLKSLKGSLDADHSAAMMLLQSQMADTICVQSRLEQTVAELEKLLVISGQRSTELESELDRAVTTGHGISGELASSRRDVESMAAERDSILAKTNEEKSEMQARIDDHRAEHQLSVDRIAQLEAELNELTERLNASVKRSEELLAKSGKEDSDRLSELSDLYETARTEASSLKERLTTATEHHAVTEVSLVEVTEKYDASKAEVSRLEKQLATVVANSAETEASLAEVTRQFDERNSELSELREQLEETLAASTESNQLSEITRQFKVAKEEASKLEERLTTVTELLAETEVSLVEVSKKYDASKAELFRLEEQLVTVVANSTETEVSLAKMTLQFEDSKRELSELRDRLEETLAASADTSQLSAITRECEAAKEEASRLEEISVSTGASLAEASAECSRLSDSLLEVTRKCQDAEAEVSRLEEQLATSVSRFTETDASLAKVTRRFEESGEEILELKSRQELALAASGESNELSECLTEMTRNYEAARAAVSNLKEQLSSSSAECSQLSENLMEMTLKYEAAKAEVSRLEGQLERFTDMEATQIEVFRRNEVALEEVDDRLRQTCADLVRSENFSKRYFRQRNHANVALFLRKTEVLALRSRHLAAMEAAENLRRICLGSDESSDASHFEQGFFGIVNALHECQRAMEARLQVEAGESSEKKTILHKEGVDIAQRSESVTGVPEDRLTASGAPVDGELPIETADADCQSDGDVRVAPVETRDVDVQFGADCRDSTCDTNDFVVTRDAVVQSVGSAEMLDTATQAGEDRRDGSSDTNGLISTRAASVQHADDLLRVDVTSDTADLVESRQVAIQATVPLRDSTSDTDGLIARRDGSVQIGMDESSRNVATSEESTETEFYRPATVDACCQVEMQEAVTNTSEVEELRRRHEVQLSDYFTVLETLRESLDLTFEGLRGLSERLLRLETDCGCSMETVHVEMTAPQAPELGESHEERLTTLSVDLRNRFNMVSERHKALTGRIDRCGIVDRFATLQKQLETAQKKVADADVLVNKYKNIAVKGKKEAVELKKKVTELGAELQKSASAVKERAAMEAQLNAERDRHRTTQTKLEQALRDASQSNVISLEIADYERLVNELNRKIADGESELQKVQAEANYQLERTRGLQTEIDQLETRVAQSETRGDQLKELTVRQRSELNELRRTEGELRTAEGVLRAQLERAAQDVESHKMQVAEAVAEGESRLAAARATRDTNQRAIAALDGRVTALTEELSRVRDEYDACQADYEGYKVRVHSVLKQQKSRTSPSGGAGGVGLGEDFGVREREQLENTVQLLRAKSQELSTKLAVAQNELESLQEEHNSVLRRNNKLVLSFNDQETSWRQRIESLQRELQNEQREHSDTLQRMGAQQQQSLASSVRHQTERLNQEHQLELELLRSQLVAAQEEVSRLQRETTDVTVATATRSATGLSTREEDGGGGGGHGVDDIRNVERQDGEGSEFTDSLFGTSNKLISSPNSGFLPLEQLLSQDDRISNDSFASADLEKLESRLVTSSKKIDHLTELLNESEATNAHMAEQTRVLKEEIRRLERNQEREKHFANMEYLKNIVVKFLSLPPGDEREHLVPVITTILRLSPEEQQQVHHMAKGFDDSQAAAGWSSYLPKWPGGH